MAGRQIREAEDPFQNRSLATNEVAPERAAEEARIEAEKQSQAAREQAAATRKTV